MSSLQRKRGSKAPKKRQQTYERRGYRARLKLVDRKAAKHVGHQHAAQGQIPVEQVPYEHMIDRQCGEHQQQSHQAYRDEQKELEQKRDNAVERRKTARERLAEFVEAAQELNARVRDLAHLHGLSVRTYIAFLVLGYAGTLPFDLAASTGLPLSAFGQSLAGIAFGVPIIVGSHFAGAALSKMRATDRGEDPGAYLSHRREFATAAGVTAATVLGIGSWRETTFSALAQATNGVFNNGPITNIALTLLSLAVFVGLTLASKSYHDVKPLCEAKKDLAVNEQLQEGQRGIIAQATKEETDALRALEALPVVEQQAHQEIEEHHSGRKHRFRHRAGVHAGRRHAKLYGRHELRKPPQRPEPPLSGHEGA